jgi:serine/threonine-protein kinase
MGEVYEALDNELGSRVAIKTILPALARDPVVVERFRREVLLARRVTHSNVCRVFELYSSETPSGAPLKFLTMEFLDGESLAQRLKRVGPMSPDEALPLIRQVVAALHAAHAQGIVHRDFKPGNVMLVPAEDGSAAEAGEVRAVVTDFGIARALALAPEKEGTQTGAVVGTPRYMAPEQLAGGAVTPATDVYALGLVMHEMVTGKLPDAEDTAQASTHPRNALERTTEGLNSRWRAAIERCLAREPERRFQSALDVIPALEGSRHSSRRRWAAAALIATAALGAFGWTALHHGGAPPMPTLAVLPFRTIGPELAEHFGLGLTDAVIGRLATSRKLTVRPTSAVQRFEAERSDAIEAGRQLGVEKVVEGTIRRVEGGTRVLVQVTDVGRRAVVWSDQLDLPAGRLFELEDTITTRLVDRLRIKLDASGRSHPVSDSLVERYLAISARVSEARSPPADAARALVAQLDAIVAEEPTFAPAVAARAYARAYVNYHGRDPAAVEGALQDAAQALKLDPELPLPHIARATVFWSSVGGWKFADAVHELRMAIELSPGSDLARFELARTIVHRGWFREVREEQLEARRLNPFDYDLGRQTAVAAQWEGHPQKAVELFRQLPPIPKGRPFRVFEQAWGGLARVQIGDPTVVAELEAWVREQPTQPLALSTLAVARAKAKASGIADLEQRILSLDQGVGHFHHALQNLGLAHAQLGDTAGAVAYLRRAAETGMPCLPCFDNDPLLASVHGTPEYAALRADLLRDEQEVRARLKALESQGRPRGP